MNATDLDDALAVIGTYWPAPPEWTDERMDAYRAVLGPLPVAALADAIYQLATTEARRLCPPPAEFLAVAQAAEAKRRREAAAEDRRALPPGTDAPPPTSWRTADLDCRSCGARLHLVMQGKGDARLYCPACNSVEVQERHVPAEGRRSGELLERVVLTDAERHTTMTVPGAEAWGPEQIEAFKARVRAAAKAGTGGTGLQHVGALLPDAEARADLWRRARRLERRGLQVDWGKLSGDGALPVAEGAAYLADAWDNQ